MRYHYYYQTKENKSLDDWLVAKDRNDAYAQLRKRGIKPYKLVGRNPLAWKRWAAIGVLAAALVATYAWLALRPDKASTVAEGFVRHQIYGDESIIANGTATGWASCGFDDGEKFLAKYAQPGLYVQAMPRNDKIAAAVEACLQRRLEPQEGELIEFRQIKEIVESMKAELRQYIASGGNVRTYIERLQERQSQESAYYRAALQELTEAKAAGRSDDEVSSLWLSKNAELRAIGLPMLKDPLSGD